MLSWYASEECIKRPEDVTDKKSAVGELRYVCHLLDVCLRDAAIVTAAKDGSSLLLDLIGRRGFLLHMRLTTKASWSKLEKLMAVGAVKFSSSGGTLAERVGRTVKRSATYSDWATGD